MNNDDWQKLLNELQRVEVQVPLHQKALRNRLLAMHPYQRGSQTAGKTKLIPVRTSATHKRVLLVGVLLLAMGALMLGLLVLLPYTGPSPAKQQIAQAAPKVQPVNPQTTTDSSKGYDAFGPPPEDTDRPIKENRSVVVATAAPVQPLPTTPAPEVQAPATVAPPDNPVDQPVVVVAIDVGSDQLVAVDVDVATGPKKKDRLPRPNGLAKGLLRAPPFN